jgi:hypothetical protein
VCAELKPPPPANYAKLKKSNHPLLFGISRFKDESFTREVGEDVAVRPRQRESPRPLPSVCVCVYNMLSH